MGVFVRLLPPRVLARSQEVQRDVRFVSDDPTVMAWRDVEKVASFHLDDATVVHGCGGASRHHKTDVFHLTTLHSRGGPDMDGPFPSRLVAGPTDRHAADVHEFEFSFLEGPYFVWLLEALNDYVRSRPASLR